MNKCVELLKLHELGEIFFLKDETVAGVILYLNYVDNNKPKKKDHTYIKVRHIKMFREFSKHNGNLPPLKLSIAFIHHLMKNNVINLILDELTEKGREIKNILNSEYNYEILYTKYLLSI